MSPFRLDPDRWPDRSKIQFTSSARMPHDIYRACLTTGIVSGTVYCQLALCEALARDLRVQLAELTAALPSPRGPSKHLYDPDQHTMDRFRTRSIALDSSGGVVRIGPANTNEEVR